MSVPFHMVHIDTDGTVTEAEGVIDRESGAIVQVGADHIPLAEHGFAAVLREAVDIIDELEGRDA